MAEIKEEKKGNNFSDRAETIMQHSKASEATAGFPHSNQ